MSFYRFGGMALLLSLFAVRLDASCGSASCPYDTRSEFRTEKGSVLVGYSFEYIDQDQPRIGRNKASVGEIHGHHDEVRTINRTHRFYSAIGLTDRLSLDLSFPVISRSHRHVHTHHGGLINEGWDFTGVGDLLVETRYAVYKPTKESQPTVYGIAGVELPTGDSLEKNADGDEAEPGITPGSKSWDFRVGAATLQHFSVPLAFHPGEFAQMPFFTSLTYKINGKGREDYRIGNQWGANLGTTYPVLKRLGFITQVNMLVREKDDRGETFEEVEKTGGTYVYASPGLQVRPTDSIEWSTVIQLPVYQHVNQIQLTSDYNVVSSLSWRFHL